MGYEIFYEVEADLAACAPQVLSKMTRDFFNAAPQDDLRMWLTRPLSAEERITIQFRFLEWRKAGNGP